jgi:serine-type D-Ala-D-Ala endopeptidase (penicillin-binding protein 7)
MMHLTSSVPLPIEQVSGLQTAPPDHSIFCTLSWFMIMRRTFSLFRLGSVAGFALALIAFVLTSIASPSNAIAQSTKSGASGNSASKSAAKNKARVAKVKASKVKSSPVADFTKDGLPNLMSHAVMVFDQVTGRPLYAKNADAAVPIASITKLMTAIIVLESRQNLEEPVIIEEADVDVIKNSRSKVPLGTAFRREDLMRLALLASDNRAAAALGRSFPGGINAFVDTMNAKARQIGMTSARFVDATGLAPGNIASPQDLALLVAESAKYPLIREFSTAPELYVTLPDSGRQIGFNNTNSLVRNQEWSIGVSKTGFINEAGKCLVMQAMIDNNPVIIVLMDSWGRLTRVGDANRIKKWIETRKVVSNTRTPSLPTASVKSI